MLKTTSTALILFIVSVGADVSLAQGTITSCTSFYYNDTKPPSTVKIEGRQAWQMPEPSAIGDFKESRYTPNGRTFELKEIPVTNQCRTSECYLFSAINYINVNNAHNNASRIGPVRISEAYLVANKFFEHISEGIWYGTDDLRVVHDLKGGFSYEAVQLSRKVGLIPHEAWSPRTPLENWNMDNIYAVLQKRVPEWSRYVKQLAQHHGSWDAVEVKKAYNDGYFELKDLILEMTGPIPTEFTYSGSIFTPKQFEAMAGLPRQRRLAIDNKPGYSLPSNARSVLDEAMVNHGGGWKFQEGDYNTIINETIRFLEAGHPVIIDFKWNNDGHSMLVVGYEYNSENKITRLKVMNSWGPNYANDGYVWYTLDDVWNNVSRVYKFGAL